MLQEPRRGSIKMLILIRSVNSIMRKAFFAILFVLFAAAYSSGQAFTGSNLPIVIINTDGNVVIPDDPKVKATMKIIFRGEGERNYLSDQNTPAYLNYSGRIAIEIRGSSSQYSEKKQYGFSTKKADDVTNNNVSLLGMPPENDWILNSMVFDSALVRDFLCFNLSGRIGEYASRTVYCEVMVNGDYRGLYLLEEKIKADNNRVDIKKISMLDNYLPEVSGGYITKADKTTGGDPVAWRMINWRGGYVDFIHEYPDPDEVTEMQTNFIRNHFNLMALRAQEGDASVTSGYPSYIDLPSFIHYMIISELSSNSDSYQFSTYFHKDRNGKLRAGPVWDSDLTFGNDLFFWGFDRSKYNVWQFSNADNEGPRFWRDLFNESTFRCYLSKRWNVLTQPGQPLSEEGINNLIDSTVTLLSEAISRENARWNNVRDYQKRISQLKSWLEKRIPWITANLPDPSGCSNADVPPLVISRIMYHPDTTVNFPDNDEREFIEITNTGSQEVDLTGVYFSSPGLTYIFPPGSSLAAGSSVFLAGSYSGFFMAYRSLPFDVYTRNLSNKREKLVLSDAYGNVIDSLTYHDSEPWPEADGNGYHLELIDLHSDNSLAQNWTASNELLISGVESGSEEKVLIYPNPVKDILTVSSGHEIISVSVADLTGRMFISEEGSGSRECRLDMGRLGPGVYIVSVRSGAGLSVLRIVKV